MIFVDTNMLVAAALKGEQLHDRARRALAAVEREGPFTTDHVLVESWAILRRRTGYDGAERYLRGLRGTPLRIEPVLAADLERATAIGELWADQQFDFVDRTSFAVMERLGCSRAATFDRDFSVYRTGADRRAAFEVLS